MTLAHHYPGMKRRHPARLLADEGGSMAIEYALLASLVAIFAMAGLEALANGTDALYGRIEAIGAAIGSHLGS